MSCIYRVVLAIFCVWILVAKTTIPTHCATRAGHLRSKNWVTAYSLWLLSVFLDHFRQSYECFRAFPGHFLSFSDQFWTFFKILDSLLVNLHRFLEIDGNFIHISGYFRTFFGDFQSYSGHYGHIPSNNIKPRFHKKIFYKHIV